MLNKIQTLNNRQNCDNNFGEVGLKRHKSQLFTYHKLLLCLAISAILVASGIQYYGGLNESMFAIALLSYNYYGLIHGYGPVFADTEFGRLKGLKSFSREGRPFYEFLGVPYAQPPIGPLRFLPPRPFNSSWTGVRDATGYGSICTQYDIFLQTVMGDEDCLTINIYTPKLNTSDGKLLPTILFFHGGMFQFGRSMDFRGHHFMEFDVILVTINYRLQALGFLNTGDNVVHGNMGLKDQVMAMKFVSRNIANFGGDANLVTIWGESAGGSATQLHVLSPMSKGLFHRGISNSGFSLAHWSFIRKPKEQALLFAKKLNCPTTSSQEMVDCLRKISSRRVAEIFRGNHDVLHPRLDVFGPTIENGSGPETFLSAHPRQLLRNGKVLSKVPMLFGSNSHEGLIYGGYFVRNKTVADLLNREWHKHSPVLLDFEDLPLDTKKQVSSQLWNFYLGNKSVGMDSLYEVVNMFSDTSFFKPMEETAFALAKHVPLYLYLYNHHGEFGVAQGYFRLSMKVPLVLDGLITTGLQVFNKYVLGLEEKHLGVCHADELALLFKMHPLLSKINPGHKEYKFSRELVRNWAYFSKYGKPPHFNGHEWTAVKQGQPLQYMKLDSINSPGMVYAPWTERLNFLNALPGFQCIKEYFNGTDHPICI